MSLALVFASVFGVKGANLKKNRMEEAAAKKSELSSETTTHYF